MIYTVGHRANYEQAIREHGAIQKVGQSPTYPGGYALRTLEDAERLIAEVNKQDAWCAWGLDADWETDTAPSPDGWWHNLLRNADIIPLHEIGE